MSLSIDTTFLTRVCQWTGEAHNAYLRGIGGLRNDDDGNENGPFYWLELVKSVTRGGNDLQTGLPVGTALTVAAQGGANNTINLTGGNVTLNGQTVAVSTNATFGSATIFPQTCTDGSALTAGQFFDTALVADNKGSVSVIRGPREDRPDTEARPTVPSSFVRLATIRVNYQAGGVTIINTADISAGNTLTAFAAPANDAIARMFNAFDSGQTRMLSRAAVRQELGFALTALDAYVQTVTASQGLGVNGAGLTLTAWAKTTHQTGSPWDFPASFIEYVRVLRGGKDPSQRLATISFTGSGTATVTDLKKVVGLQDKLELVVTSAVTTGSAASTVNVTTQSYGATTAIIWTAAIPASQLNGTVIALASTGTTSLQTPLVGTAINTAIAASAVIAAQPAGTVAPKIWTALVPSSPVSVVGGTSGDAFAVRNVGTL